MAGSLLSLGSVVSVGAAPAAPADASCFSPAPHNFADVPSDSFANMAVSWLVEAGITEGVTPTEFRPNGKVTRAQMAVFLWRTAGEPEPAAEHAFADVPSDSFANTAISWLVEEGITQGITSTEFQPNGNVNRGQMAAFLWRAEGEPVPAGSNNFDDVSSNDYFNDAVSWLVEAGITKGITPTEYQPNGNVTRAQMAVFLHRNECGPQPTDFASAAYGSIYIGVFVAGDPDATPPTEDETIPVNIPVTGVANGGWAQEANGPFNVDLAINSGSFPLTVLGLDVTVSYSVPENATGAGYFNPETGVGGFDMDMVVSVDETDLLGPMGQPCELTFGMSLDGQIDANTGMLSASQNGFDVTPPAATDCGGLGGIIGPLLSGPDNSANLNFLVSPFAPPTAFDSASTGNIHIDVLVAGDPDATPPTEDEIVPVDIPVAGQAKGVWSHEGAGTGAFIANLDVDSGSFPLEVLGLDVIVSYSVPNTAAGAGQFDPNTGVGGFDMDIGITVDETDLLGAMGQPCDLTFGMSLDGQIDANTGMLTASQNGFDVTPPAATDCGGLGAIIGPLLSGPGNSVDLEFEVSPF